MADIMCIDFQWGLVKVIEGNSEVGTDWCLNTYFGYYDVYQKVIDWYLLVSLF